MAIQWHRRSQATGQDRQRGVVVLVMVTTLALLGAGLLLDQLNRNLFRNDGEVMRMLALHRAKEALLAYSGMQCATVGGRQIELPCPDFDGDGVSDEVASGERCHGSGVMAPHFAGYLPWRTLGLPPLKDEMGQKLWYLLADQFQEQDDGAATLTVDGAQPVVAMVVAPGAVQSGQVRHGEADDGDDLTAYLDGENSDGDADLQSRARSDGVNDTGVVVTATDLEQVRGRWKLRLESGCN